MIYRNYGKTGEKVSFLGFGGMRFEDPDNLDKSVRTVIRAFDKGVTYFDTAPHYCNDKSEDIMGTAINEMKRNGKKFYISTKTSASTIDKFRKDLEKSLKRLNVECIDFYNMWCLMSIPDWEKRKTAGVVNEILKAKEEGLIRHAVFTSHQSGDEIRKVIQEGYFEGVTLGYSAANFAFREEGINSAGDNGLGVVVMNPLNGGLIPDNEDIFSFLKIRKEQNIIDAAIHFLLNNNTISTAIVGFRNEQDVDMAVSAVESFKPYTDKQIQQLESNLKEAYNTFCTTCMYCNVCPEDIPVWKFMEAYNNVILKGGKEVSKRLRFHWHITDLEFLEKCTMCGKCEEVCTQHLPILERFEDLKKVYKKETQTNT